MSDNKIYPGGGAVECAKKTPLVDLLRGVPKDGRVMYEVSSTEHHNIPYGPMCHEAADEIERLRNCIRGLTDQNAALIWDLQGHGDGEPIPDVLVQNAALTGENMMLKHELAACQRDAERLRAAIERMRVAGGSHEFQMAFELAKDLL